MPAPNQQQIVEALQSKNVSLECRSCGNTSSWKLDVGGVGITALGAVNTAVAPAQRFLPMALVTCGACGDTRLFYLTWLGFPPPY